MSSLRAPLLETGYNIRFVRLEHKKQYLHVQQVQVIDNQGKNWALASMGAKASQSSDDYDGAAEIAIDGITDRSQPWPSCNHTKNSDNEHWEVDLGREVTIKQVIVYNRPNYEKRLQGCKVLFLSGDRVEVYPSVPCTTDEQTNIVLQPMDTSTIKPGHWMINIHATMGEHTNNLHIAAMQWHKVIAVEGNSVRVFSPDYKREIVMPKLLVKRASCMDWCRRTYYMASDRSQYFLPLSMLIFFLGYYVDIVSELLSVWTFWQTKGTLKLAYAMLFIVFVSPMACWTMMYANSMEKFSVLPQYLLHLIPAKELLDFRTKWHIWRTAYLDAIQHVNVVPPPMRTSAVMTWLPLCKSVFASSLTLILKIYGEFLDARDNTENPKRKFLIVVSCGISMLSMSWSIVNLSHHGVEVTLVVKLFRASERFFEVFARTVSISLFGVIFDDQHSISAVLLLDFLVQLLMLLLHPSSRMLMRREMNIFMVLFWSALMVLAAPPIFIPQLADMHPVYYTVRLLELLFLILLAQSRCQWLAEGYLPTFVMNMLHAGPDSLSRETASACKLANPVSTETSPGVKILIIGSYVSSCIVFFTLLEKSYHACRKRLNQSRLKTYRAEQLKHVGDGLSPLKYSEVMYLRSCSLPNRFLAASLKAERGFVERVYTAHVHKESELETMTGHTGWIFNKVLDYRGQDIMKDSEVRFGDVIRIQSALGRNIFLSGGRRGCNMFVVTSDYIKDLQDWPLAYDLDNHYQWRIVAVNPGQVFDTEFRLGEPVDLLDSFYLQACPDLYPEAELFLSCSRGGDSASKFNKEVWSVSPYSWAAFEDAPLENRWPSFEFTAQRKFCKDGGSITKIMEEDNQEMQQRGAVVATAGLDAITKILEEHHREMQRRGAAMAAAGYDEDLLMQTFMMQSGVPLSVTKDSMTPLHHFVLQYAREGDEQVADATKEGDLQVQHKVPVKLFDKMLHSGLPNFEMGAKMMYTPLHFAALLGERKLCDLLLRANADINVGDSEGWTPLHDALLYGHKDMLIYLLNQPGINVDKKSRSGLRPKELTQDREILGWFKSKGASKIDSPAEPLPPTPDGDKFRTVWLDPRGKTEYADKKCRMDNGSIQAKFLATNHEGFTYCFFCARAAFCPDHIDPRVLMPAFRCPECHAINRISYYDSLWDVCWVCHRCTYVASMKAGTHIGKFPGWQRLEAGAIDNGGKRAAKLFKEIDVDASGGLDLREFKLFFKRLHGEVSTDKDTGDDVTILISNESKYVEGLFEKYDRDHNGTLSLVEFKRFLGAGGFSKGDVVRVMQSINVSIVHPFRHPEEWTKIELESGRTGKVIKSGIDNTEIDLEDALIIEVELGDQQGGQCDSGLHDMILSDTVQSAYQPYVCNGCRQFGLGSRWFCPACRDDYCFECRPYQEMDCLVNGPESDKLEIVMQEEDDDIGFQMNLHRSSTRDLGQQRMARQKTASRRAIVRRTTFSGIPCLESCLLLS